eukprot:gene5833-biopygen22271
MDHCGAEAGWGTCCARGVRGEGKVIGCPRARYGGSAVVGAHHRWAWMWGAYADLRGRRGGGGTLDPGPFCVDGGWESHPSGKQGTQAVAQPGDLIRRRYPVVRPCEDTVVVEGEWGPPAMAEHLHNGGQGRGFALPQDNTDDAVHAGVTRGGGGTWTWPLPSLPWLGSTLLGEEPR